MKITKVIQEPHISICIDSPEELSVFVSDCSIHLQNSIIADIGPYFESPIAPDPTNKQIIKLRTIDTIIEIVGLQRIQL